MDLELIKYLNKTHSNKKGVRSTLNALKKYPKADIDERFQNLHNEAFKEIDCLKCANCCKTTSPIFEQDDIDRISKYLGVSAGSFIQRYLHMDEDGDFVLNSSPCAFLKADNKCKIYDVRPKACADYPHTNRKRMQEILDITYENAFVCPAVGRIVSELETKIGK